MFTRVCVRKNIRREASRLNLDGDEKKEKKKRKTVLAVSWNLAALIGRSDKTETSLPRYYVSSLALPLSSLSRYNYNVRTRQAHVWASVFNFFLPLFSLVIFLYFPGVFTSFLGSCLVFFPVSAKPSSLRRLLNLALSVSWRESGVNGRKTEVTRTRILVFADNGTFTERQTNYSFCNARCFEMMDRGGVKAVGKCEGSESHLG